jgi:hypothetical protein
MALPHRPSRPAVPPPDSLAGLKRSPAGPDGIRRELVERVRALIVAGEYDTDDRWLVAQDRLFGEVLGD